VLWEVPGWTVQTANGGNLQSAAFGWALGYEPSYSPGWMLTYPWDSSASQFTWFVPQEGGGYTIYASADSDELDDENQFCLDMYGNQDPYCESGSNAVFSVNLVEPGELANLYPGITISYNNYGGVAYVTAMDAYEVVVGENSANTSAVWYFPMNCSQLLCSTGEYADPDTCLCPGRWCPVPECNGGNIAWWDSCACDCTDVPVCPDGWAMDDSCFCYPPCAYDLNCNTGRVEWDTTAENSCYCDCTGVVCTPGWKMDTGSCACSMTAEAGLLGLAVALFQGGK